MKELLHETADAILVEMQDEGCYIDYAEALEIAYKLIKSKQAASLTHRESVNRALDKQCQDHVEGRS